MKIKLFIFIVCLTMGATAQTWQWGKRGGSTDNISESATNYKEQVISMATDSENNVYILSPVGKNNLNVDGVPKTNYGNSNTVDYMIASFTCTGVYRWSKVIGGGGNDNDLIRNIIVDADDNVYAVGDVRAATIAAQAVHFDEDVVLPTSSFSTNTFKKSLFIIKYNNNGVFQWLKMPQADDVTATTQGSSGEVVLNPNGTLTWLVALPAGTYAEGAYVTTTPGGGSSHTGGSSTNPSSTGNEDEIPIIPNFEGLNLETDGDPKIVSPATNIKRLNKLTKNVNGQKTIFKEKIDEYIGKLNTNYTEEGIMYGSEYGPIDGECTKTSTSWSSYPVSHYVAVHMHQNFYYVGSTLKPTNPVMSDADVAATLNFYFFTENMNATTVLVSRQGTFALKVNNGYQASAASDALANINDTNEKDKFNDEYNDKVQNLFENGNESGALNAFINFVNTYQVNGQPMGLELFQAVFDSQQNIINWVKL